MLPYSVSEKKKKERFCKLHTECQFSRHAYSDSLVNNKSNLLFYRGSKRKKKKLLQVNIQNLYVRSRKK